MASSVLFAAKGGERLAGEACGDEGTADENEFWKKARWIVYGRLKKVLGVQRDSWTNHGRLPRLERHSTPMRWWFTPYKGVETKVQAGLETANVLAFAATQELREMGELIPEN